MVSWVSESYSHYPRRVLGTLHSRGGSDTFTPLCHLILPHKEAERAELISHNLQVGTQPMSSEVTGSSLQSHSVAALGTGPRCPDPSLQIHSTCDLACPS